MLSTACSHDIYTHKSLTKCFSLGTFPRLHFGDLFLFRRRKETHTVYYILVMQCFRVVHWEGAVASDVSRLSSPDSSPGQGHCVVFLGKTLYSHSSSLHPCGLASHLGGVEIPLVISCYRNQNWVPPDGPLASYADFTFGYYTMEYPTSHLYFLSMHMSFEASVYTKKIQGEIG